MFQRKPGKFRRRSNGRGHRPHGSNDSGIRLRTNSFSNGPARNNFRPQQSAEKLYEKYTTLAKEAMSSGDKTLFENYMQHADHFIRVIEDKNKNRNENKFTTIEKKITSNDIQAANVAINENLTKDKE